MLGLPFVLQSSSCTSPWTRNLSAFHSAETQKRARKSPGGLPISIQGPNRRGGVFFHTVVWAFVICLPSRYPAPDDDSDDETKCLSSEKKTKDGTKRKLPPPRQTPAQLHRITTARALVRLATATVTSVPAQPIFSSQPLRSHFVHQLRHPDRLSSFVALRYLICRHVAKFGRWHRHLCFFLVITLNGDLNLPRIQRSRALSPPRHAKSRKELDRSCRNF